MHKDALSFYIMNKLLIFVISVAFTFCITTSAYAKEKQEVKLAKVWFKDGKIYEGPLVKHWVTYGQRFTRSKHNFHILPDDGRKTIKCYPSQIDSIYIISSTHRELSDSVMYVPMVDGIVPMNGPKKNTNKMLRRIKQGTNVGFCTLLYMGNYMSGLKNRDQLLSYWLVRFHDNGEAFVFYSVPIGKGANGNVNYVSYFYNCIKDTRPRLAEAVKAKYFPDKETSKKMAVTVDNKLEFIDFIDDYISEHPE